MADISKITLPSGTTYNVKDAQARADIANLQSSLTGAMHYIGTTTTVITDGATTNPVSIGGEDITATSGDVVIYDTKEYVFSTTDNKWHEFGSTGSLKALAFEDTASAEYTPAGTVSKPTFTGTATTSTGKFTPAGSVDVSVDDTTNKTATVSAAASGAATYTPDGTISTPTATVTMNTTTVNSITEVGTLPECTLPTLSTTVSNETLNIGWTAGTFSQGTLPTKGSDTTVATTVKSATVSQPTFTGTGVRLVTESIPVPDTFTATFTGTEGNVSVSGTPTGDVTQPTFTGTTSTITVS